MRLASLAAKLNSMATQGYRIWIFRPVSHLQLNLEGVCPSSRFPPSRVEEQTFRHTFTLPQSSNPKVTRNISFNQQAAPPSKTQKLSTGDTRDTPPAKGQVVSKQSPKRKRRPPPASPEEALEQNRAKWREQSAKRRTQSKATGICVGCSQKAIPGQTRCTTCRDKHRATKNRKNKETGKRELRDQIPAGNVRHESQNSVGISAGNTL